jgi:hypothetical protein
MHTIITFIRVELELDLLNKVLDSNLADRKMWWGREIPLIVDS